MGSKWQVEEESQVEETVEKIVADGIKISPIRSGELNITLGIQQLVDVAVRALSSGIKDPHTAVYKQLILSAPSFNIWHLWTLYPWFFVPRMAQLKFHLHSDPSLTFYPFSIPFDTMVVVICW